MWYHSFKWIVELNNYEKGLENNIESINYAQKMKNKDNKEIEEKLDRKVLDLAEA